MATNYNMVVLVGKLTADPELKYEKDATPFAILDLRVATELHVEIAVRKHQAELCCQFLSKGSEILISGELEEFIGEIGNVKCSKLRVKASRVQFLDKKKSEISASVEGEVQA